MIDAHNDLVQTIERSEFSAMLNLLISGDDGEVNEVRALQMLADQGGQGLTSRPLVARYGFSSTARIKPTLHRLQRRGLIDEHRGIWKVVDPFFEERLRRTSPLAGGLTAE